MSGGIAQASGPRSFYCPHDLYERARAVAERASAATGEQVSVSDMLVRGLIREVALLEAEQREREALRADPAGAGMDDEDGDATGQEE